MQKEMTRMMLHDRFSYPRTQCTALSFSFAGIIRSALYIYFYGRGAPFGVSPARRRKRGAVMTHQTQLTQDPALRYHRRRE